MKPAAVVTLLVLTGLPGIACADQEINKSLDADPAGVVVIDNVRGVVTVTGWTSHQVTVKGSLDDLAEKLEFVRDGKVINITVKLPGHDINSGDGSNLDIKVPVGSRVEFKGVSSSAKLSNIQGGVSVRTISGDVNLSDITGEVSLKGVSGDVEIDKSSGPTRIKSVSGDLGLALASTEVTLTTVSGDIELHLAEFDSLAVTSVSGDLDLSGTLRAGGRLEISTVSGDCGLLLNGAVNARATIKTGPGGSITNKLSDVAAQEDFPAQERLETTFGDGTGTIAISTLSGDIKLEKP